MSADLWQELVTSALLGSDRKPFQPGPPTGEPVADLLAGLDRSDPHRLLLSASATIAWRQRAGRRAEPASAAGTVAEIEPCAETARDLPRTSTPSSARLGMMLAGTHADALPEWLELAAARGRRASEEHLPGLLAKGQTRKDLQPKIVNVLGRRGEWLAKLNPDWSYACDLVQGELLNEEIWQIGEKPARQLLLAKLREADPNRARELLASTWSQEPAADKVAFLGTFQTGLSMADEPFLEQALDSRGSTVIRAAADLLAQLAESRYCRRMIERAKPLIRIEKSKLKADPPESCSKEMQRDGIEPKSPQYGVGDKGWWLREIVAAIPPAHWTERLGLSPVPFMSELPRDWKEILLQAVAVAAGRHRASSWSEALISPEFFKGFNYQQREQVLETMTQEQLERLVARFVVGADPSKLAQTDPLPFLLNRWERPWKEATASDLINYIEQGIATSNSSNEYTLASIIPKIALNAPATLLSSAHAKFLEAAAIVPKTGYWSLSNALENCLSLLQFRLDMIQELDS